MADETVVQLRKRPANDGAAVLGDVPNDAPARRARRSRVKLGAQLLRLVSPPVPAVDADTVWILEKLLAEAKAGRCTGLAYVAAMGRRGYVADTHGDARRSPTWTRGALRGLDDKLAARIR